MPAMIVETFIPTTRKSCYHGPMKTLQQLSDEIDARKAALVARPSHPATYATRAERRAIANIPTQDQLILGSQWYTRTTNGWTYVTITDILHSAQGTTYAVRGRTSVGKPYRPRRASELRAKCPRLVRRAPPAYVPTDIVVTIGDLYATRIGGLGNCPVIIQCEFEPGWYECLTVHTESTIVRTRSALRIFQDPDARA